MDRGQRAVQLGGCPQFLERQVGLVIQQPSQLVLMAGDDAGLAAGAMMLGPEIAEATAFVGQMAGRPTTAGTTSAESREPA